MKYYENLLSKACFNLEDVFILTGNKNTANSLLQNYLKKGYVQNIKRNLYVAINLADNAPVANCYSIGSHITDSAYISHHSAFAYYGYTNQVVNEVYVSSSTVFRSFEFDGLVYKFLQSRIDDGIVNAVGGVKITDLERTVTDSMNDFEKVAGLEELLRSLSLIPLLDEQKLFKYLKSYNKQVLFQKAGYILEHFKDELNLSDDFFVSCKADIKKSVQYLSKSFDKEKIEYNSQWQLFVPKDLLSLISEGSFEDADI